MRKILIILLFLGTLIAGAIDLKAPIDDYRITSTTGYRKNPMGGNDMELHKGVDLVGPHHCEIRAAADGIVVDCWPAPNGYYKGHPALGGLVIIDHGDGMLTLYGHLSVLYVRRREKVKAGDVIGRQGRTGICTGEHLHWEVIVNPLLFIREPMSILEMRRRNAN